MAENAGIKVAINIVKNGQYQHIGDNMDNRADQFIDRMDKGETYQFYRTEDQKSYIVLFSQPVTMDDARKENRSGYLRLNEDFAIELMKNPQRVFWLKENLKTFCTMDNTDSCNLEDFQSDPMKYWNHWKKTWEDRESNRQEAPVKLSSGAKNAALAFLGYYQNEVDSICREREQNTGRFGSAPNRGNGKRHQAPPSVYYVFLEAEESDLVEALGILPMQLRLVSSFAAPLHKEKSITYWTSVNLSADVDNERKRNKPLGDEVFLKKGTNYPDNTNQELLDSLLELKAHDCLEELADCGCSKSAKETFNLLTDYNTLRTQPKKRNKINKIKKENQSLFELWKKIDDADQAEQAAHDAENSEPEMEPAFDIVEETAMDRHEDTPNPAAESPEDAETQPKDKKYRAKRAAKTGKEGIDLKLLLKVMINALITVLCVGYLLLSHITAAQASETGGVMVTVQFSWLTVADMIVILIIGTRIQKLIDWLFRQPKKRS